ncbi:hypothetical protein ACN4EK_01205 [Pantanalinema rosaneae CENA516]|uniref:hypothetical protein n=1 Tax=Pantanalinema rosaneae TaxID=1620701 RepID=UPI003D6E3D36
MKLIQRQRLLTATIVVCSVVLSQVASQANPGHDHHAHELPGMSTSPATPASAGSDQHHHKTLAIPSGQPVPTVKLVVHPDALQGWNLEVQVTNFRFAPERINQQSITTEGHAHLYIDGQKLTRLYGSWYHLANLAPGEHRLTVTLNANGHEDLTHEGQPIAASAIVQVPPR